VKWQKVDERWAKKAAATSELEDGVTFTTAQMEVPGEDPLTVRVCKRKGHPEEKLCYPTETPKTSIVLHHTSGYGNFSGLMGGGGGTINFMIGRDGNCYQIVRSEWVAWHATWWNPNSIGIEIDNIGQLFDEGKDDLRSEYTDKAKSGKKVHNDVYCDKSEKGVYIEKAWDHGGKYWAAWKEEQYRTLGKLLKALCKKHGIPRLILPEPDRYKAFKKADRAKFKGICVHVNIEYDNRDDLGPYVDWDKIIQYAGLTVGDCFSPGAQQGALGDPPPPGPKPPLPQPAPSAPKDEGKGDAAKPAAAEKPKAEKPAAAAPKVGAAKDGAAKNGKNVTKVKIGDRPGRLAISVRQPGEPIPTCPPWSGDQSAPQADGKRDDFLRSAMGLLGRSYKPNSHDPEQGFDGAGLVVFCLKRVGLFAGDDVWPSGPTLAAHYHVTGADQHSAPDGIIPGDLAWFGLGDHDTDDTQHPMIWLGGGRVLGPVPDNGTNNGVVQDPHLADVPEHFAGWTHIDDLGTLTTHTEHPGQPAPGTVLSAALLPADPAQGYDFLKDLVAAKGGKWLDEKGKVNLVGILEMHDRCQISPRQDDWNDTLFAAYQDEAGIKCVIPMRASLNPGTDKDCKGSWQLVDGSFAFKLDKGDSVDKALIPDGNVKGWFDANGQGALRPGDDPHDKVEEKKQEDDEPLPDKETFEGSVEGPGGPMKKWPFKLLKDGKAVDKDGLSGGTTKNEFKNGVWLTDAEGKFEFKDVPQGKWSLDVVLGGGKLKVFDEGPPPKGATERGQRAPHPEPVKTWHNEGPQPVGG